MNEENRAKILFYYELMMLLLAITVLVLLIIDLSQTLTPQQKDLIAKADLAILVIFAADYFYNLAKSDDKKYFIRNNIFDLIAIMPFDKVFRLARLARISRLARLSRLSRTSKVFRVFGVTGKVATNIKEVLQTNGLKYMIIFTILTIVLGAVVIQGLEPSIETFGDAIWWSMAATGIGSTEIAPETTGGRFTASVLMIVGIGLVGMVTGSIATYFLSHMRDNDFSRKTYDEEQIKLIKKKLDNLEVLSISEVKLLTQTIHNLWRAEKNRESNE